MGYAHEYAVAVMNRARVQMEPVGFEPDWVDRPRKEKFYPDALVFPLPAGDDGAGGSVADGCLPDRWRPDRPAPTGAFTLGALSGMLQDSYGLVGRRLAVQANTDLASLPRYTHANWSRGTASGGGLYPVSVYWVAGPSGPLTPGVYAYSPSEHAVRLLLAGDVSGEVREALGGAAAGGPTDQYLVLGIKYWQNSFKYNSFSFHAVSMDVGTVLQTWRIWARARGLRLDPAPLWFDEARLNRLLGVPGEEEGLFAVVPLAWDGADPAAADRPAPGVPVRHRDQERSHTVLRFDALLRMHAATAEGAADCPAPGALEPAAAVPPRGDRIALPDPELPDVGVREAVRARRSSFGRFDAVRPLSAAQLATALAASAGSSVGAAAAGAGTPRLATLYAFVNHVEGIAPGAYAYDPVAHALCLVKAGPSGAFLQRNYNLPNYNLEQAGAVLVPAVRTTAVLDAVGDRGYRLVNATVGAVSQTFYTVASAMGLGAGVALGFDNLSFAEELGLDRDGEAALLIMLLGYERPNPADFHYEIV
ncbi:nitroreductase family protein [Streptacidiphilus sp. N1-3]|uniref:Nitroreductase family protein n=1 Tax=Streptacidiphilus alkalitolerans TaxID=3342712 RepID=A0ABV6XA00_9ACTN